MQGSRTAKMAEMARNCELVAILLHNNENTWIFAKIVILATSKSWFTYFLIQITQAIIKVLN